MGTNYYLESTPPCECCKRAYPALHIGKSSGGWCFSLHVDQSNNLNSLADWVALWSVPGAVILDEYGRTLTPDEMFNVITKRKGWYPSGPDGFAWSANHAELGPNGLVRHQIGQYCIGHGEGTWDLIPGEFS